MNPYSTVSYSDHYAAFLYFTANSAYRSEGNPTLATKIYLVNRALNSVDLFYEVELPEVFTLQHPIGTVLGRAKYGNYLRVYQNCLVGQGAGDEQPTLGDGVVLYAGSSVIGSSRLGGNVIVGAGTLVSNAEVPANSVVVGSPPNLSIKKK